MDIRATNPTGIGETTSTTRSTPPYSTVLNIVCPAMASMYHTMTHRRPNIQISPLDLVEDALRRGHLRSKSIHDAMHLYLPF